MKKLILTLFFLNILFLNAQNNDIVKEKEISTVQIKDESDPKALKILDLVEKSFSKNHPFSLDSYSFSSYHKYSADLDKDSIAFYQKYLSKRMDSLQTLPKKEINLKDKKVKDSIENQQFEKMTVQSQMFLWEMAKQYQYSQKLGEKIVVLDNRISGLQNPVYELLTMRSNINTLPKEIKAENRDFYRFFLTESTTIDGRKTFVIKFRQLDRKSPANRRKFTGFIYVDEETYGIKKIESISKKLNEGNISSTWQYLFGKWFLVDEKVKIRISSTVFKEKETSNEKGKKQIQKKKFGIYFYGNSQYSGHQSPINIDKNDFKGYTLSVKNADGSLMEKFRKEALTPRELNTYAKIDSVGESNKLDQKVNFISSILRGKIRIGIVDYDPLKSFHWNGHEGIRLGLNAKLNEKFHHYISPDAYIAYGFADKKNEVWCRIGH